MALTIIICLTAIVVAAILVNGTITVQHVDLGSENYFQWKLDELMKKEQSRSAKKNECEECWDWR
jgi:uncharacterized protein YxeA